MAFTDLQQFTAALEQAGRLKRVAAQVDPAWEIACVARWVIESFPEKDQFAIQFDNVAGASAPVVVGLYASRELYAKALGITTGDLLDRWSAALREPVAPRVVSTGPVMDVVARGSDADLRKLPIPVWTPGRDGGPYIPSAAVITKDPETGIRNVGVYRIQIHAQDRTGLFFGTARQHGAIHYAKYCRRNEPMPVALVIGGPPVVQLAAAAKTAYGVDELEIAGGLLGAPVEVAPAQTVDLDVPAHAEYVIEGLVSPEERHEEGPFGEALGYMNPPAPAPVIQVSAICQREQPILHGYVQQLPPSEGHLVWEIATLGCLGHYLRDKMGLRDVRDLAVVRGSAGLSMLAVQLALPRHTEAAQIARVLSDIRFGQKFVVLVDEDIDIHDGETVLWALTTRVDPGRDVSTVDGVQGYQLDPSVLATLSRERGDLPPPPYPSSLMVVDATVKCDTPALSIPTREAMERARQRWDDYGLPDITPRARFDRLLEHHGEPGCHFTLPRVSEAEGP